VREILSAREIVDRITREAETLLSRGARQLEAA
jgi:hypothetical protein